MKHKLKELQLLTMETASYLRKLAYSESRISQYRSAWQRLAVYMERNNLHHYSATVAEAFICQHLGSRSYTELDSWDKAIIQCVNTLTEFQETGSVKFRRNKKYQELQGPIGKLMTDYIFFRKSLGIAQRTLEEHRLQLYRLLHYFNETGISSIDLINHSYILDFVNQLGFYTPGTRHRILSVTKGFFRYLYDYSHTETDYSHLIPKVNYKKQAKLPTVYSQKEVELLISAIERSSPKGKRDYAMVLLAARLGLRSSDICNLKFKNLLWEQNLIAIIQQKTGERLTLPLLTEIGEAIVDYLKYGRPSSELDYVFLHVISPYDRLNPSTLHSIVCLYLRRAGIKNEDKHKHGPHALRHSLAGILMEKKTPLPVISEVLGHKNTESTKFYLRIDITSLRQCVLEVPPLSTDFYERGPHQ